MVILIKQMSGLKGVVSGKRTPFYHHFFNVSMITYIVLSNNINVDVDFDRQLYVIYKFRRLDVKACYHTFHAAYHFLINPLTTMPAKTSRTNSKIHGGRLRNSSIV